MSNLNGEQLVARLNAGEPIPTTITLEAVLAALKIIAQIIPIIDGMIPAFVRWWKAIFGTKEERQAVRAFKILNEARKVLEAQAEDRAQKVSG